SIRDGAALVVGPRVPRRDPASRVLIAQVYSALLRRIFRLPVHDIDSVKLYRAEELRAVPPRSTSNFFEAEILISLCSRRRTVRETEVPHRPRIAGAAKGVTPGAAFFVIRLARRGGAAWWVTLPLAVAALLVSKITWTDRPHLFTLALFPVLLELLLSLPAGASRRLFVFPPLLLVWSYLHGGYLIGLAVLAIFAAHAVLVSGRAG